MTKLLVELIEQSINLSTMDDLIDWLDLLDKYEQKHENRDLAQALEELRIDIRYKLINKYSPDFYSIVDLLFALTDLKKERMIQIMKDSDQTTFEYRISVCWMIHTAMLNIPMKVKLIPWSPSVCPRCGVDLSTDDGDGYYTYPSHLERCPECGQMLTWFDGEN